MKRGILILLDILYPAGAEYTAVNIAVRLKQSKDYSPIVCVTRHGGALEGALRANNVKYFILGRTNTFQFYKFHHLKKVIEDENIKLIHAHKKGSNFWGSILGKVFNLPSVLHFQADHPSVSTPFYLIVSRLLNKLCTRMISISEYETERLIKQEGMSRSKIVTIYNSIDYKKYKTEPAVELRNQLGIDPSSPVVGMVAGFRPQKNHEDLLLAAHEVLKRNQKTIFLLVGDGSTRQKSEDLAAKLGIKNSCIFTGVRNDIPDIDSIIDIGLLSTHWEGLPLCVLEYMASSKPVVCTDVSGISELVKNTVNGFLVPPGDYHALAERINLLIENKSLAEEIGKNALSTVKEKFSEEAMMDRIQSLYDEILSNNN